MWLSQKQWSGLFEEFPDESGIETQTDITGELIVSMTSELQNLRTENIHCIQSTEYRRNKVKGLFKKRQNPKTRQNRDNTHENDKNDGYTKTRAQEKKLHTNKTTKKSFEIFAARIYRNVE